MHIAHTAIHAFVCLKCPYFNGDTNTYCLVAIRITRNNYGKYLASAWHFVVFNK